MGELSKHIGEIGEKIAEVFFEKIGWKNLLTNQTLPCIHHHKHALRNNSPRQTHGIDKLFSYQSQTESETIHNVYISCKNSTKAYSSNPIREFKSHIQDLIFGLECFKRSQLKSKIVEEFKSCPKQIDVGVLFWISCEKNTYDNVIDKIASTRIDFNFDFGNIYIIDNAVALFHIKIINYIESSFKDYKWSYYIPETSIGYSDKSLIRHSNMLPVEFINSKFIIFRLDNKQSSNDKPILLIVTKDNFTKRNLEMYIHAAREYTSEITNKYHFIFPDYSKIDHESDVQNVKMALPQELDISVTVNSFNNLGIRGLYND